MHEMSVIWLCSREWDSILNPWESLSAGSEVLKKRQPINYISPFMEAFQNIPWSMNYMSYGLDVLLGLIVNVHFTHISCAFQCVRCSFVNGCYLTASRGITAVDLDGQKICHKLFHMSHQNLMARLDSYVCLGNVLYHIQMWRFWK